MTQSNSPDTAPTIDFVDATEYANNIADIVRSLINPESMATIDFALGRLYPEEPVVAAGVDTLSRSLYSAGEGTKNILAVTLGMNIAFLALKRTLEDQKTEDTPAAE